LDHAIQLKAWVANLMAHKPATSTSPTCWTALTESLSKENYLPPQNEELGLVSGEIGMKELRTSNKKQNMMLYERKKEQRLKRQKCGMIVDVMQDKEVSAMLTDKDKEELRSQLMSRLR
jgi:hypothetical protein